MWNPFGFFASIRVFTFVRHATPRSMPKRKSVHKKVKFIAMKKAKDDEEKEEEEQTGGKHKNKLEERNLHYWNAPPTI